MIIKEGYIYGLSNNYVKVKLPCRKILIAGIVLSNFREIDDDGLIIGTN